ncbi:YfbK domain-containing protein [Flavobacterium arcticum]
MAAAITTLSVEEVEDRANASLIQNLQGQVAGLNIGTDSEQPGADSTIILRGVGTINGTIEPLFVVDGIPVDEDGFRSISQNDIASYNILKDAAATSIYGNRGANGVIVITTKSGNYSGDGNYNIQQVQGDREEIRRKIREINTTPRTDKPLYIIDGVPVDEETFNSLNSDEISDLKILKDPYLTAVYGSKGKNGVVIINTNKIIVHKHNIDNEEDVNSLQEIKPNAKIQIDQEDYESFEENEFENPAIAPLSTFSIDVDNASYTNVRRFLNNGQTVPKDAVRIEEMINFFKYQYPQPTGDEPFSINTEYSDAPWNKKHKLLKIGLKGVDIPTQDLPASNFVFLIDVSGSMNSSNKLPLLKESMKLLVNQMREEDRIAIVVYAGAAGLVLPSTSGAEKSKIIAALDELESGGSTAGGAGIELAYKTAQENFIKKGNNCVILATDGDFNVGASSNGDMQTLIEEKRKSGVFLTCLGYGMGNYKDSKMEILADKGNGNYAYIDTMQEADRFLQKEFKGSMYAIAKDVKIQIEFNPKHVQSYRLIGYENRKLRDEDFANDAIDAGELGSGHTVTALYEIIPVGVNSNFFTPTPELKYSQPNAVAGNYSDELATIKFRHKKPDEDVSKETVKVIPNVAVPLYNASGDFKFAAAVAWFGLKLRDSELIQNKESDAIKKLAKEGLYNDPEDYRAEFIRLVNRVE